MTNVQIKPEAEIIIQKLNEEISELKLRLMKALEKKVNEYYPPEMQITYKGEPDPEFISEGYSENYSLTF